jgi:DNA polymerase
VPENLATIDFETYSEAGYKWTGAKWEKVVKGQKPAIGLVGAHAYAEHPSTEILCLAYDLLDGRGPQLWTPSDPPPRDLFDYVAGGGLLEATNSQFEFVIWNSPGVKKLGWPPLPLEQLRDVAAKARSWGLPGSRALMGKALGSAIQKDKDGTRLINKFSIPRKPTKNDPRLRIDPATDVDDGPLMYAYCLTDVTSEMADSQQIPDLSPFEEKLFLIDQKINNRGVAIDLDGVRNCSEILKQVEHRYTAELQGITNGAVQSHNELQKIGNWLAGHGFTMPNMQKDTIVDMLENPNLPPLCRRVLEIRVALNSAAVKKLGAIERAVSSDGRLRGMFVFAGATRTQRWTSQIAQLQNMRSRGPATVARWNSDAVESALAVIGTRDLDTVEAVYGSALDVVGGCLRGLFVAGPGCELVCSDYSAIEAVGLAQLAGEQWRLEVFRTHRKIYEMSAAKISGVPFEEFIEHKARTGDHHPLRKRIGKVAELASGYQGWIGAWQHFGADEYFDDEKDIKEAILKWRAESPAIVEFWGGQYRQRGDSWQFDAELYGIEGAAVMAILNPGKVYGYRGIQYGVFDDVLYCRLPSGRRLAYHEPRLEPCEHKLARLPAYKITYMGHNTDSAKGAVGWVRLETWGGKLVENIVQAACRDRLAYALYLLDAAGVPVVLHVHDEIVCETEVGTFGVDELERIMGQAPPWASEWPIVASGGWRGHRFRKD